MPRLDDVAADLGARLLAELERRRAPRLVIWGGRTHDYAPGSPADVAIERARWSREQRLRRMRTQAEAFGRIQITLGASARQAAEALARIGRAFAEAQERAQAEEARRRSGLGAPPASPRRRV